MHRRDTEPVPAKAGNTEIPLESFCRVTAPARGGPQPSTPASSPARDCAQTLVLDPIPALRGHSPAPARTNRRTVVRLEPVSGFSHSLARGGPQPSTPASSPARDCAQTLVLDPIPALRGHSPAPARTNRRTVVRLEPVSGFSHSLARGGPQPSTPASSPARDCTQTLVLDPIPALRGHSPAPARTNRRTVVRLELVSGFSRSLARGGPQPSTPASSPARDCAQTLVLDPIPALRGHSPAPARTNRRTVVRLEPVSGFSHSLARGGSGSTVQTYRDSSNSTKKTLRALCVSAVNPTTNKQGQPPC